MNDEKYKAWLSNLKQKLVHANALLCTVSEHGETPLQSFFDAGHKSATVASILNRRYLSGYLEQKQAMCGLNDYVPELDSVVINRLREHIARLEKMQMQLIENDSLSCDCRMPGCAVELKISQNGKDILIPGCSHFWLPDDVRLYRRVSVA